MMYVLLLLSIVLGVCKSGIYNRFAKAEKPDAGGIFTFNAVSYGTAAIVTFLLGVGKDISYVTFACAAVYAVFVFSLQALSVAAMRTGPMSLTSLFVLYGMIIPSLAGPIFWREKFGVFRRSVSPSCLYPSGCCGTAAKPRRQPAGNGLSWSCCASCFPVWRASSKRCIRPPGRRGSV